MPSVEDKNRAISEALEPFGSLPDSGRTKYSPLAYWKSFGSYGGGVIPPWTAWQPIDWLEDGANHRLLKMICKAGWFKSGLFEAEIINQAILDAAFDLALKGELK